MSHERITLEDTLQTAMIKLCGGNPGALRVCIDLVRRTPEIDPDNALGGLGTLLNLDTYAIYGADIWMLYKDVCGEDYLKTIGLLRAVQLGIISEPQLKHAVQNRGDGVDVDRVVDTVSNRLSRFGGPLAATAS